MLMSVIAWILLGLIAAFIANNIVGGRVKRAEGYAETIDTEQAGKIATTNIVIPTRMTRVARTNLTRSRDLTNTWSHL